MSRSLRILIVEDEMLIGARVSLQLTQLGHEVTGVVPRGEEAIQHVRQNPPDLILLDVQLKGSLDGIETAREIQREQDVPIIYLTANADEAHFERARATRPFAFLGKPFKRLDLRRAVELVAGRLDAPSQAPPADASAPPTAAGSPTVLEDRLFVRHGDKLVRLLLEEVLYLEADRSYCRLLTREREYLLSVPLKELEAKMNPDNFMRVHRSFVINLRQIDALDGGQVQIADRTVPVSKAYRETLLRRFQTI